jgi:hypothetical protein
LIYGITTDLSENQDLDLLGDRIFARLKSIFVQDRSYLALFLEDGTLKPLLSDGSSKSMHLSRSIVNRVFQNGESLLLEDAISDHDLRDQESVIALRIRSALCVPLIYHNQIYSLIQEVIESWDWDSLRGCLPPHLSVETHHLMVPLDTGLFKKAFSMIFQEILPGIPRGSAFKIHVRDAGNALEILLGEIEGDKALFEPSDRELQDKPWSLGLFLNIAHKIVSDHGGQLLLDPEGHMAFPLLVRIPRTIPV